MEFIKMLEKKVARSFSIDSETLKELEKIAKSRRSSLSDALRYSVSEGYKVFKALQPIKNRAKQS